MSNWNNIHLLTAFPPANANRDEQGRPKVSGDRIIHTSASKKRAWRFSAEFSAEQRGIRTRQIGPLLVLKPLTAMGVPAPRALQVGRRVVDVFTKRPDKVAAEKTSAETPAPKAGRGRGKKDAPGSALDSAPTMSVKETPLVFLSLEEQVRIAALVERASRNEELTDTDYEELLTNGHGTIGLALFGRMQADRPEYNVEAAVSCAPAISITKAVIEEDYWVGMDDLVPQGGGAAAGDTAYFGAQTIFYQYLNVDRRLLLDNLAGNKAHFRAALRALLRAAATVVPRGGIHRFAHNSYAHYMLVEQGDTAPCSYFSAFLPPIADRDPLGAGVEALESRCVALDAKFGPRAEARLALSIQAPSRFAPEGGGTLNALLDFVAAGS